MKRHLNWALKRMGQGLHQRLTKPWSEENLHQASGIGIGLMAAVLGVGCFWLGGWESLERSLYTTLFKLRNHWTEITWDNRLVVVAIDDDSLTEYGPYPWPRDRYAALLDKLMAVQPAAIGFNILMSESTPADPQLAESIRFSGNVVLGVGSNDQGQVLPVAPSLTEGAKGFFKVGHVKHTPDPDGISRQIFLYERSKVHLAPSFAIAVLAAYQQNLTRLITATPPSQVSVSPHFQTNAERYDQAHPLWINWPGPTRPSALDPTFARGLTTWSYRDVMAKDTNSQALASLQNKIVLVGYTAAGLGGEADNRFRTPFEQTTPTAAVYLHAAVLDNLLQDRFLTRLSAGWTVMLIVISGIGSVWLFKPRPLRQRLIILLGIPWLAGAIAYYFFLQGLWLPIGASVATGLLGMAMCPLVEQRERQVLRALLTLSVSSEVAGLLWRHRGELLLQGHLRTQELTATLLFSDIRGFTATSKLLAAETLMVWLNRYFEAMADCIMAQGGVIDKYIGDAIMAAFGAPIPGAHRTTPQQDAWSAVAASVAMVEQVQTLNQAFRAQGLPPIHFVVGLHTGPLIGGTVGNRQRASYSLFGDTVNIAARLQEAAKWLTQDTPYPILMSQATYQQVRDRCTVVEKGAVQLRGQGMRMKVYALKSLHSAVTPAPEMTDSVS